MSEQVILACPFFCTRAPERERDINDVSGQQGGVAKSDNDPAQTILVKSFSNLGAMKGGSRMIVKTDQWTSR